MPAPTRHVTSRPGPAPPHSPPASRHPLLPHAPRPSGKGPQFEAPHSPRWPRQTPWPRRATLPPFNSPPAAPHGRLPPADMPLHPQHPSEKNGAAVACTGPQGLPKPDSTRHSQALSRTSTKRARPCLPFPPLQTSENHFGPFTPPFKYLFALPGAATHSSLLADRGIQSPSSCSPAAASALTPFNALLPFSCLFKQD